jgi:alkanesulfonate monooxygenase SsuD/methylene tetrahydromethanopterin reductase-like flavin-dependent oxidoreductase (luciferase family)
VDVFVFVKDFSDIDSLRDQVCRWEALGIAGVLIPDHLFVTDGGPSAQATQPDPVVVLAAIGALSPSLKIGTIVANVGFAHPALTLRHFAQLAVLFGGDRVLAGLGAGWNSEEFDALGLTMPRHSERVDRLGETLRLARSLFSDGVATIAGASVVTRRLPLFPRPEVAPKLLLGGGSDRFLSLAGAYADWVDLNGSSRRLGLGRDSPVVQDGIRRLTTTVTDLEESVRRLTASARKAGRPAEAPSRSVFIDTIEFCRGTEVREREERLRQVRRVSESAVDQCPYVLIGPASQMRDVLAERRERLGLSAVIVPGGHELEPFMNEVIVPSSRSS